MSLYLITDYHIVTLIYNSLFKRLRESSKSLFSKSCTCILAGFFVGFLTNWFSVYVWPSSCEVFCNLTCKTPTQRSRTTQPAACLLTIASPCTNSTYLWLLSPALNQESFHLPRRTVKKENINLIQDLINPKHTLTLYCPPADPFLLGLPVNKVTYRFIWPPLSLFSLWDSEPWVIKWYHSKMIACVCQESWCSQESRDWPIPN